MKKALPYLGAALSTLAMTWSAPVVAQDSFKDVPQDHWAYAAVAALQKDGILLGYPPEGFFKGRRYLTRYEFAIALKRALDKIGATPGPAGKDGANGKDGADGRPGEAGPQGPAGMTPEEVATLRRLTDEFKNELAAHGANIREIMARLDALGKQVAELKAIVGKLPQWGVDVFTGIRSDTSRTAFFDRGGAGRGSSKFGSNVNVLHDVHLKPTVKLGNDATFTGDLVFSNYLSYRGANLSSASNAFNTGVGALGTPETILPYQAQLDIPVSGFGRETTLTLGRYKQHLTSLTYMRPDLDPYFYVSSYDDGNYVQDGFRLSTKLGSVKTQLFGASFATITDQLGRYLNQPLVGAGAIKDGAAAGNARAGRLIGIDPLGNANAANQVLGLRAGIPLAKVGNLGVTVALFGTSQNGATQAAINPNNAFNTVTLYGADLRFNDWGKLKINGEVAKTVTSNNFNADGQSNDDNSAYRLNAAYNTGAVKLGVGYNYIDPRYGAPGAWLTIGNWYNPTNVQGPYVRVGYKFSDNLNANLHADYLRGARNRSGLLGIGDNIARVRAGFDYKLSSRINLGVDYEGIIYSLSGAADGTSAIAGVRTNPVEQYFTVGAGIKLNNSATWKLGWQILNTQNGSSAGNGFGGGLAGSNATVVTSSVAIKF